MSNTGRQSLGIIQKTLSAEYRFFGEIQQLTVTGTASLLSQLSGYVVPPQLPDYVLIEVEAASTGIRFGFGQVPPTTTLGIRKFDLDVFDIENPVNIGKFQVILAGGGAVVLNVQFGQKL